MKIYKAISNGKGSNYIYATDKPLGIGYDTFIYRFNQPSASFNMSKSDTFDWIGWNITEANEFEKQWLLTCIKEARYVSKDEIKWKSSYEIYY